MSETPDPLTVLTAAFWNFDLDPPDAQRIAAHAVAALVEAGLLAEHYDRMAALRAGRRVAGACHGTYVHHLDGDPTNDDPSNLVIVRAGENAGRAEP